MNIYGYTSIEIGARDYQQDAFQLKQTDDCTIAILCDGMGGLEEGQLASQHAVKAFLEKASRLTRNSDICEELKRIAVEIDDEVSKFSKDTGTTLVGAVIFDKEMHWVSVGDSKMYLLRDDEMICPFREHIFLNDLDDMLEAGTISAERYELCVDMGEALTSYIGIGNLSRIEANPVAFQLKNGDQVLLCSDGLYKSIGTEGIQRIVTDYEKEPETILEYLQTLASEKAGRKQDNTTIILLQCKGE